MKSFLSILFLASLPMTWLDAAPSSQIWGGGSNTWYEGTYNGTTGNDWSSAAWNGPNDIANFNTTPGTITVDDTDGSGGIVGFAYLNFNSATAGTWDIKGGDLYKYSYTDSSSVTTVLAMTSTEKGSVVIDSNLLLDEPGYYGGHFMITDSSATGNLTINGNITAYSSRTTTLTSSMGTDNMPATGTNAILLNIDGNVGNAAATSNVINLNGTISGGTSGNTFAVALGGSSAANTDSGDVTYNLGSTFVLGTGSTLSIGAGTVKTSTSNLGNGTLSFGRAANTAPFAAMNRALLTVGNLTITNPWYISAKGSAGPSTATIGTSDNGSSIFSGTIGLDSTNLNVTAAAGGTATFSGVISNHAPTGLTKTGAGKVIFSAANTYTLASDYPTAAPVGTVAMDIQQGTVQIDNTTGSAFGGTTAATVSLEAGTTLSGAGISTQMVNVMAANSVLAPGDGAVGGVLKLYGGINAANGLTMNFTIDALGNDDAIDTKQGVTVFGGTITLNFTSSAPDGSVLTGHEYDVVYATGGGNWTEAPGTIFTVNGPAGYTGTADFDSDGILSVTFATAPEPSTWAMLLGGVGLLVIRLRRLQARA